MSTYRVALCEDEAAEQKHIAELCREVFAAQGMDAEITAFSSADELRRELGEKRAAFDLYLLDIEMKEGLSGLELARQLYGWGVRNRIIFVTGNPEYAIHGYDVEPIHYLLKPVSRAKIDEAICRALSRRGAQSVTLQRGGKTVSIPLQDIRYVESRNHGIVIHLQSGEQAFAISLADAERLLPAGAFCRCHRSYLVNLAWVERATHSGIQLKDGGHVPMSRLHYSEFQNALVHRLNS